MNVLVVCAHMDDEVLGYRHLRFGDSNQDHRAVCQASLIASRSIATVKVPRVLVFEIPSSTDVAPPFPEYAFQPTFYVDVHAVLRKKLEAMRAYRRELREFPHPRSLGGLAEAFLLVRDEWG